MPSFTTLLAYLICFVLGALASALVFRNNLAAMKAKADELAAFLAEIAGHIKAATAEEEAKIMPKIKAFIAAHMHLF